MKITMMSVMVDDQDRALTFYTDVLGFVKKHEIPMGEFKRLTVVSPEQPDGPELVIEPDAHPAAKPWKSALVADGIPIVVFGVDDVYQESERLKGLRRAVHPGAGEHGAGLDRRVRRHLRQPHPDPLAELTVSASSSTRKPPDWWCQSRE